MFKLKQAEKKSHFLLVKTGSAILGEGKASNTSGWIRYPKMPFSPSLLLIPGAVPNHSSARWSRDEGLKTRDLMWACINKGLFAEHVHVSFWMKFILLIYCNQSRKLYLASRWGLSRVVNTLPAAWSHSAAQRCLGKEHIVILKEKIQGIYTPL